MSEKIIDLAKRLDRIEEIIAAAAAGEFNVEIDVDIEAGDNLTSVETGINLLLSDLADEVKMKKQITAELERAKKEKRG